MVLLLIQIDWDHLRNHSQVAQAATRKQTPMPVIYIYLQAYIPAADKSAAGDVDLCTYCADLFSRYGIDVLLLNLFLHFAFSNVDEQLI